ncbi:MAG TPA: isoprenylcysteine carboxylmethyltransferase family protein [Bacteroidales bacterium]|nr:isoprenylcysteine carboxylmethyltransferase family protein [Bacteroidales bacterium]
MKHVTGPLLRIVLLAVILTSWWLTLKTQFPVVINLSIIAGDVLLTYPLVWLGRKILDRDKTPEHAVKVTTFVHSGLGFTFGIPIVLALSTHDKWSYLVLPVPPAIGLILVFITGTATFLTVLNLALKGFGAPFFIRLSRKLAADWMYAWTRNPMVLAALTFLVSLGIWFQSVLFVVWALIIFSPALLFFVRVFEEKELEYRFGSSYLEYKSRTPLLFPRKPGTV